MIVCHRVPQIESAVWVLAFARTTMAVHLSLSSNLAPAQERQPLEQVHVLLVLEQRAVQRRDQLARVALPEHLGGDVLVEQELQPIQKLARRGLLLQARHLAYLEEDA